MVFRADAWAVSGTRRQEWRRLYRAEPPRLSRDLMMRAIAYRIQEIAFGGLSKATLRRLAPPGGPTRQPGRVRSPPIPAVRCALKQLWPRTRRWTAPANEDNGE